MTSVLLLPIASAAVFAGLVLLYAAEDVRGDRVVFKRLRDFLDRAIKFLQRLIDRYVFTAVKVALHSVFYYLAQKVLRRIFFWAQSLEARAENILRQHGKHVKHQSGDRERNHLDDIADHKAESALSEKEIERLKSH